MDIYTSYFAQYSRIPAEYQCVSIANSKPENILIPTWNDTVPSWDIVEAFKNGESYYDVFKSEYCQQLSTNSIDIYAEYLQKFNVPVVLLCWERDAGFCHRTILANYLAYHINSIHYAGELTQEELL